MASVWTSDSLTYGIFLFVLGSIVGSFLNVCIHRIPRGESLIKPPSKCRCGAPIPWFLNLPVISWLLLRGRASCCGRSISFRYFLVEVLTGAVFAYAGFHFEGQQSYAILLSVNLLFACILIATTFIDYEKMIIPDRLSVGGMIAGVVLAFAFPVLWGWWDYGLLPRLLGGGQALIGVLVGSGTMYWVGVLAETLLRREAIGQGDVKLLGCVGAFCGWQGALFCIFGGALVGTVLLLPVALLSTCSKHSKNDQAKDEQQTEGIGWGVEVPFGPFLAFAALLYQFGLDTIVDGYFEQFTAIFRMALFD
ncbi:MAG: prepilin peptidase [Opitutales bacterium]